MFLTLFSIYIYISALFNICAFYILLQIYDALLAK